MLSALLFASQAAPTITYVPRPGTTERYSQRVEATRGAESVVTNATVTRIIRAAGPNLDIESTVQVEGSPAQPPITLRTDPRGRILTTAGRPAQSIAIAAGLIFIPPPANQTTFTETWAPSPESGGPGTITLTGRTSSSDNRTATVTTRLTFSNLPNLSVTGTWSYDLTRQRPVSCDLLASDSRTTPPTLTRIQLALLP